MHLVGGCEEVFILAGEPRGGDVANKRRGRGTKTYIVWKKLRVSHHFEISFEDGG